MKGTVQKNTPSCTLRSLSSRLADQIKKWGRNPNTGSKVSKFARGTKISIASSREIKSWFDRSINLFGTNESKA